MSIWHIYGGNRLTGSTRVQGAKNAVLPIMAASVLCGGETVLYNVPDLRDVTITLRILRHLGCTAVRDGDTVRIDSRGMHCEFIPHALMRELRSHPAAVSERRRDGKRHACRLRCRGGDGHLQRRA